MRKLAEQLRRDVGALANQHERFDFRQAARELPEAAHRVVEDLHFMVGKHLEAVELADGVLVVVENGNFHGVFRDSRGMSDVRWWPPRGVARRSGPV